MSIAIQLIISNLLIIAMGVFVFVLQNKLKKKSSSSNQGGSQEVNKEVLNRIDNIELRMKNVASKDERVTFDQFMELKRSISTLNEQIKDLNTKTVKNEKGIKDLSFGLDEAIAKSGGMKEADFKKFIEDAVKRQSGAKLNEEYIEKINKIDAIEQAYNKVTGLIDENLNELKKETEGKLKKTEVTIKTFIEDAVKRQASSGGKIGDEYIDKINKIEAIEQAYSRVADSVDGSVADIRKEINEKFKKIEVVLKKAEETGGKQEVEDKIIDFVETNINDMKQELSDKVKKIESALKKVEETDYELIAKHIFKEGKDKFNELIDERTGGLKSGVDDAKFSKAMEKQDMIISGLKEYIKETIDKMVKKVEEIEEKQKSDEKMIDFMDANMYEIRKKVDQEKK